jgi:hypothetical protein
VATATGVGRGALYRGVPPAALPVESPKSAVKLQGPAPGGWDSDPAWEHEDALDPLSGATGIFARSGPGRDAPVHLQLCPLPTTESP